MAIQPQQPLIMQFGTSRFLQAHVDYFIGQSLAAGRSSAPVAVVQTSASEAGKARVAAMTRGAATNNSLAGYPVRIQGLMDGQVVDSEEQVRCIECAMVAQEEWPRVVQLFWQRVTHVVSNTADSGYQLHDDDHPDAAPPRSFPAKLLVLLLARYQSGRSGVTIMPCELVANNGQVLKEIVLDLARAWALPDTFIQWLGRECLWVNSLVDRIVSQAIEPLGAVAEPYALWAIEQQPGLALPCEHEAIRCVPDLAPLEWLKLGVLNLSHTYLVELWQEGLDRSVTTVHEAMQSPALRAELESMLQQEVIPILRAMELGEEIDAYVDSVRERFQNPFLHHRLDDIAQNHPVKLERRILPIWQQGRALLPQLALPRLTACLGRHQLVSGSGD